jgi:hypothetical protein
MTNGRAGKSKMLKEIVSKADQGDLGVDFRSQNHLYSDFNMPQFTYIPGQATLTLGQFVEIWPKLAERPMRFQLGTPLPAGLSLNLSNGVIQGTPLRAAARMTVVVQAILTNNRMMRGTVDIDVVDFSRGGYVVGHISELEPGRFMVLLHVPDGAEDGAGDMPGSNKQFANNGGRQARKLAGMKKPEAPPVQAWALHGARGHPQLNCLQDNDLLQQQMAWALQDARMHQQGCSTGLHENDLLQHQQMVELSGPFMQRF